MKMANFKLNDFRRRFVPGAPLARQAACPWGGAGSSCGCSRLDSRGRARRVVRVFCGERLQLGVAALELKIAVVQLPHLGLQLLNMCLEPRDTLGQVVDGSLLQVRLRRPLKNNPPEGFLQ